MQAAFAASIGRPQWWVLALAAFLVRGGIVLVLLPLISLPSAPALATAFAPTVEALAMSRQSPAAALVGAAIVGSVVALLVLAAYLGSWLDAALAREAEASDFLDLQPPGAGPSAWRSLAIRLVTHVPTLIALGYAVVRIVVVTYQELLAPGDPAIPIALRVLARAPDTIVVLAIAWLLGEAIGGLAARRTAEGETLGQALRGALRDIAAPRGVATFVVTDAVVVAAVALLLTVVGQAAQHVRSYLYGGADAVSLAAALLLLVLLLLLVRAIWAGIGRAVRRVVGA
jgi:hypothetical protein